MRGLRRGGLSLRGAGRYRLVRQFSEDPIGTLWLAQDVALGPSVTIRVLRDDLVADARFAGRLRSEFLKVWPRLKDPNVPSVITYTGERQGQIQLVVMRAFQGESLAQRIDRAGALEPTEAAQIASQIESALDAAHEIGLVHGGVTAHSVVLTARSGVKVIDFGIPTALWLVARDAHRLAHDVSNGDVAFTTRKPDAAHDARSLQRLKQHMLSGSQPDAEDELTKLVDLLLHASPRPATPHVARLPKRVGRHRPPAPVRVSTPASASRSGVGRRLRRVGRPLVRAPRAVLSIPVRWGRAVGHAVAWFARAVMSAFTRSGRAVGHAVARSARATVSVLNRSTRAVGRGLAWSAHAVMSVLASSGRAVGHAVAWFARAVVSAFTRSTRAVGRGLAWSARALAAVLASSGRGVARIAQAIASVFARSGRALGHAVAWFAGAFMSAFGRSGDKSMWGHHRGGISLGTDGRYRLIRKLSEDPIGTLWLARDIAMGPSVTIRLLRDDLAADARFVRRLRSELDVVWPRLKHANIPSVITYAGDRKGQIRFLVMRAFTGESLAQRVRRAGALDLADATRIASQIEEALDAAHEIGLVHGGVTAHSVVLTDRGGVKVTDFGIPTALLMTARDGHLPLEDVSNGPAPELTCPEPDADHDARSLERLMQHMLSGSQAAAEGELPRLVDLVLAAPRPPTRHAARFPKLVRQHRRPNAPARVSTRANRLRSGMSRGLRRAGRPFVRALRAVVSIFARSARAVRRAVLWFARAVVWMFAGVGRAVVWFARAVGTVLAGTGRALAGFARAVASVLAGTGRASARSVRRFPTRASAVPLWLALMAVVTTVTIGFVVSRPSSDSRLLVEPTEQRPSAATSASPTASPTGVPVPQVSGLSAMEAGRMLARVGLLVAGAVPAKGPPGRVVGTDPPGSQIVDPGTSIILLVGAPPERLETKS